MLRDQLSWVCICQVCLYVSKLCGSLPLGHTLRACILLAFLPSLLQVMVSEGGVPYLVHGLVHPDLEVSCCCSEMLARLASTHQQQHLEAIR